jgi:hypothetical protein
LIDFKKRDVKKIIKDEKGDDGKKETIYKIEYWRLRCFMDFTCLLYPLQLVASNRMINSNLLEAARSEANMNRSALFRDLDVIKSRVGLYRGFLPYMLLTLNNSTWLSRNKF